MSDKSELLSMINNTSPIMTETELDKSELLSIINNTSPIMTESELDKSVSHTIINNTSPIMIEIEKNLIRPKIFNAHQKHYFAKMGELINGNSSANLQLRYVIKYFKVCPKINAKQTMYLIDSGANVNLNCDLIWYDRKTTILHEATKFFMFDLIEYLINHNADPNIQDYRGQTALIRACRGVNSQNGFKCIELLLNAGADPDIQDNHGKTALMFMVEKTIIRYANPVIISLIKSSDVSIRDTSGKTAYECYEKNKNDIMYYDDQKIINFSDYDILVLKGESSYTKIKSARHV